MMHDVEAIARSLTKAQREAFGTLPLPGWTPHRAVLGRGINRSYSSIWRKSAKHWQAMLSLEADGLVERKVSRGETLWRPTKPLGLEVAHLLREQGDRIDGEGGRGE